MYGSPFIQMEVLAEWGVGVYLLLLTIVSCDVEDSKPWIVYGF